MKTGLSLSEMATEIERQYRAKKDYVAPTQKLEYRATAEGRVVMAGLPDGVMTLRPVAHAQMASNLGIPKVYYDRMLAQAPDLLARNANQWLREEKDKSEKKLVRTIDGEVRAVLTDSYRPLDNYDLAHAVLPKLQKIEANVMSCQLTESRMYLKAVSPKVHGEVKVGDVLQAGVVISNSEVGQGSIGIDELDYRLVCLNGMVRDSVVRRNHVGRSSAKGIDLEQAREYFRDETRRADDRAFFLKVGDAVNAAFLPERFDRRLNQYREAAGLPITKPVDEVVELVSKKFDFTEAEKSSVLTHLAAGGDLSKWGMANAVTRMAQDVQDYDRSTDLEAIGGQIITLPPGQWKTLALAA